MAIVAEYREEFEMVNLNAVSFDWTFLRISMQLTNRKSVCK